MHKFVNKILFKVSNEFQTNLSALDFIELPSMQTISLAVEKLHILGFMDDNYDVTAPGFYANQISFISIENKKMILSGYNYGAYICDLITITAFVETDKRYVFAKSFKLDNFIKKNGFEFYSDILIADDFVSCIFIWNQFQEFLSKRITGNKSVYLDDVRKWCDDNEIIFNGLLTVVQKRDVILENLISIGLNPYYNSLDLKMEEYNLNTILKNSLSDGLDEIKKIKMCLYEGYKCNVLFYKKNNYMSIYKNIPVKVKSRLIKELDPALAEQIHPNYIVVDSYIIFPKNMGAQHEFLAQGFVSVLDNFIDVDESFYVN